MDNNKENIYKTTKHLDKYIRPKERQLGAVKPLCGFSIGFEHVRVMTCWLAFSCFVVSSTRRVF